MTIANKRVSKFTARRAIAVVLPWAISGTVPTGIAQPIPLPPPSRLGPGGSPIEVTREQGLEFVTVRDASVTPVPVSFRPAGIVGPFASLGQVSEPFRMSRTETTYAEYFNFLQAWLPYSTPALQSNLTGVGITYLRGDRSSPANYVLRPGRGLWGASMPFRIAQIYCNWLHNDRRTTADAFANGAYDTSTFGGGYFVDPDGQIGFTPYTDQVAPSPGARFWIPDVHQMLMAGNWDSNRFGPSQGGWWRSNLGQDSLPIEGLPGTPGAQSSGGLFGVPTLSYLDIQNPWGLFDVSGGASEWIGTAAGPAGDGQRYWHGSGGGGVDRDMLDTLPQMSLIFPGQTVRIAAAIPSLPATSLIALAMSHGLMRRTRQVAPFC